MSRSPNTGHHTTMDKAIARDIDRQTGATDDASPRADDGRDDPVAQGARTNARQHHQGAARDTDESVESDGGEAPGMAQRSGKTGKAPKGGKDSGAGNERGSGGPSNSRKDAGSA